MRPTIAERLDNPVIDSWQAMRELFTAAIALHCIQERDQNVFVVVILQNSDDSDEIWYIVL